jgi:hypothetical protein
VIGDDNATNSIGKSSFLMIVDFVFGGDSLIKHNKDIVKELGEHEYFFTFKFGNEAHRFCRGTLHHDVVYLCDENRSPLSSITITKFRTFLRQEYFGGMPHVSFRSIAGLFSRVWGKKNLDVHRPLHSIGTQPALETVDTAVKAFGMYEPIASLAASIAELREDESAFRRALRREFIPKIGKSEYKDNVSRIKEAEGELAEIKEKLALFALSISSIANRDMKELKGEKDQLLDVKLELESRLGRIRKNLKDGRFVKSRNFHSLKEFFPEVNQSRLLEIETFHSKLASLLKDELHAEERQLVSQLEGVSEALNGIDTQIATRLGPLDAPGLVVERVLDLSAKLRDAQTENDYFEKKNELHDAIQTREDELVDKKRAILKSVEDALNAQMRVIVERAFGPQKKSPQIVLEENNYSFEVFEDTGTGTAYSSLLVLDLAFFALTKLPLLIHDSMLYKNIENDAVARLLFEYVNQSKQSFIAIDEVDKYGVEAASKLRSCSVVSLSDDFVLFKKDWRVRGRAGSATGDVP